MGAKPKIELAVPEEVDEHFGGCRYVENAYDKVLKIGEGTYGEVYLAKSKRSGDLFALKKIRMDNEKDGFPITAVREIRLLASLRHENVVYLKEIVRSTSHKSNNFRGSVYMVFEYMDHDLTGLMERQNHRLDETHVKCYLLQLLHGVAYLHEQGVIHRDLKASNLLVNNNGILKVADFGLARPYEPGKDNGKFTNRVITLWYRPPELILGSDYYGPEIDMWSVGCIFAEMLMGKALFQGKDEADQLDKICNLLGSPNEKNMPGCEALPFYHYVRPTRKNTMKAKLKGERVSDDALDLLEKFLTYDPKKRITAKEALKNKYFGTHPFPSKPHELPKFEASHEMAMKHRRKDKDRRGKDEPYGRPVPEVVKRPKLEPPPPTICPQGLLPQALEPHPAPVPQQQQHPMPTAHQAARPEDPVVHYPAPAAPPAGLPPVLPAPVLEPLPPQITVASIPGVGSSRMVHTADMGGPHERFGPASMRHGGPGPHWEHPDNGFAPEHVQQPYGRPPVGVPYGEGAASYGVPHGRAGPPNLGHQPLPPYREGPGYYAGDPLHGGYAADRQHGRDYSESHMNVPAGQWRGRGGGPDEGWGRGPGRYEGRHRGHQGGMDRPYRGGPRNFRHHR